MPFSQLSTEERQEICRMLGEQASQREIARQLDRSPSTISREIGRNACPHDGGYCCEVAGHQARQRRRQANEGRRKLDDTRLGEEVRARLAQKHAPEQITGRLPTDFPDDPQMRVSHETTYRYIYEKAADGDTIYEHMRQPRRKRKKRREKALDGRGKIPGCVNIEHRPEVVDRRLRFGDWESDTIHGAAGRGGLATHVERESGYLVTSKLENLQAETFTHATIELLRDFPPELLLTMTCDNGKEFALFKAIEQALGIAAFFANPHSPWERGVSENTNGLLRQFFPKGTDFRDITPEQVAEAEYLLNNRPRKRLNYRTPAEVMAEILSRLRGVALRN